MIQIKSVKMLKLTIRFYCHYTDKVGTNICFNRLCTIIDLF